MFENKYCTVWQKYIDNLEKIQKSAWQGIIVVLERFIGYKHALKDFESETLEGRRKYLLQPKLPELG